METYHSIFAYINQIYSVLRFLRQILNKIFRYLYIIMLFSEYVEINPQIEK